MDLSTQRLSLQPWQTSDWTALRTLASNPEVMRYITGGVPWTDEQTQSFVERQVNLYAERGFCRWKLMHKSNAAFIGFCGAGFWRDAPDPEIGWWLTPEYWGLGLATEAAHLALHDAFERVGVTRLISIAMPENSASIRIMQKLGLKLDAKFESNGIQLLRYAINQLQYSANKKSAVDRTADSWFGL